MKENIKILQRGQKGEISFVITGNRGIKKLIFRYWVHCPFPHLLFPFSFDFIFRDVLSNYNTVRIIL
jgi:hypothetical protein